VRPTTADQVELYGTKAEAEDAPTTTGRIEFESIGTGVQRTNQTLSPFVVARVDRIEKEVTDGFVRVYAWDTGRETFVALLSDMQPGETTSSYRRIRVGQKVKWIRMKYRKRSLEITSERDFINLDSKMAILMMVQSQDLLLKRFADEAERYRMQAVDYLNKRNRALDGPRVIPIQINADITTVPDDWMD
jgi:hypothetical protein